MDVPGGVIRSIVDYLKLGSSDTEFSQSQATVIEKHQRYRKYITKIFDYIQTLSVKKSCVVVLYALKDDTYKVIL